MILWNVLGINFLNWKNKNKKQRGEKGCGGGRFGGMEKTERKGKDKPKSG